MERALFICVVCLAIHSAQGVEDQTFSPNPDLSAVISAGGYAAAPTVRVEMLPPSWTINRFGNEVPIIKPDSEAKGAVAGGAPIMHLHYLALRGLADLPALCLEVGGLPYRATYYGKQEFLDKAKGTFEFGRVPVLVVEGHEVSQSASIVRFIAEKAGLAGATIAEKVRTDVLFETYKDLFVSHGVWGRAFDVDALRTGPTAEAPMLHFRETSNRGEYTAFQKAAVALKTFEDLLAASSSGYLVSGNMTYVDLALWQKLHELGQPDNLGGGWADQLGMPHLGAFASKVASHPKVAAFVHSGRRMPRIKRIDGDYKFIEEVLLPEPSVPQIENREL